MKAKILFCTAFLLLQSLSLFSQCISIELSVTYEMGADIFNKDSIVSIPKLNITYRNSCDTNYYFFKASPMKDGNLMVGGLALIFTIDPIDYRQRAMLSCGGYVNQNFNVIIGIQPSYGVGWIIFSDTVRHQEEYFAENVSCSLKNIYEYLYPDHDKNYIKKPAYFVQSDITPENILDSISEQFVFLKTGETLIDTYSLIGFKLVEGCFTFLIDKNVIENYVTAFPEYDSETEKFIRPKFELPAVVGEYQLYSGGFNTNKVTVCFGER